VPASVLPRSYSLCCWSIGLMPVNTKCALTAASQQCPARLSCLLLLQSCLTCSWLEQRLGGGPCAALAAATCQLTAT
jgi:hypothetical protein